MFCIQDGFQRLNAFAHLFASSEAAQTLLFTLGKFAP
jgi:hypothetical protein